MSKRTLTYNSWASMLTRIRNPRREDWRLYGGRGITVCKRWLEFKNFLEDMGERPKGTSLDRINSNGNYTPKNCRWATALEQVQGRRKGYFIGEKNNQAQLTWKQVKEIRSVWDHHYITIQELAAKFKVSFGCIAKIVYNDSWREGN